MIQLLIDYSTNKILGYNTIIPENTKDLVLVEEDNYFQFTNKNNLYYENNQIIEKEEQDSSYQELENINNIEREFFNFVNNEQKIFMDNILAGKTIEEATEISKANREQLNNVKKMREQYEKKQYEKKIQNIVAKFEQEEEEIQNKYFLSALTAVRDENEYLEEWLNYHIEEMEFDHFYIYDNESAEPIQEYLEKINYKYLDKVTIIPWVTSEHTQQDTCNHWLKTYGSETKWFICMDIDEFVKIKEGQIQTLKEFLESNSVYSSIKCKWKHYTANGHVEKTDEPVMERFTVETDWSDWKQGGKYFAQSNRVNNFISYVPQVRMNMQTLDFNNQTITDFYQLNHYYTKSYEEYVQKIERGSVNPNYMRRYQEFFEVNPDMEYLNTGEQTRQTYGSPVRETIIESEEE